MADSNQQKDNIILKDEEGTEYEILDTFAIDSKWYVCMIIADKQDNDEYDDHVYIYQHKKGNKGKKYDDFIPIEDEVELSNVFAEFKSRNKKLFDFDEDNGE